MWSTIRLSRAFALILGACVLFSRPQSAYAASQATSSGSTTSTSGASSTASTSSSTGTLDVDGMLKVIDEEFDRNPSKEIFEQLPTYMKSLEALGFSDAAIAAVFANGIEESSLNPSAGEAGNGTGVGIWQFSNDGGNKSRLQAWSADANTAYPGHTHTTTTAKGCTFCTDFYCQLLFCLGDTSKNKDAKGEFGDGWMTEFIGKAFDASRQNNSVPVCNEHTNACITGENCTKCGTKCKWLSAGVQSYLSGGNTGWAKAENIITGVTCEAGAPTTWDEFKQATDPVVAGFAFFLGYERGAGMNILKGGDDANRYMSASNGRTYAHWYVEGLYKRAVLSKKMYEYLTGNAYQSAADPQLAQTIVNGMVSNGLMDESQFVAFEHLTQLNLSFPDRDLLSDEEIYNMELWKNDLDAKSESLPARILRWFAMLFAIVLMSWSLLFYLAYWFDRVNNLIQVDMLRLITFGKLTVSPTEEECTFSVRELAKGECRTVNNRKALEIVALCLAFGFLIISGVGFIWIRKFITFMLHVLRSGIVRGY